MTWGLDLAEKETLEVREESARTEANITAIGDRMSYIPRAITQRVH
jgi:hypothetical protein